MTGTERTLPAERVWVFRDQSDVLRVKLTKPDPPYQGVEYMRVLSRAEVEKLAYSTEGVDTLQLINSLERTIDGQRKHIVRLQRENRAESKDSPSFSPNFDERNGIK